MTQEAQQWRPVAGPAEWSKRADMLAGIRRFFDRRGVMEVETPLACVDTVTDPNLEAYQLADPSGTICSPALFLQTSPEYAMKRLLAAGSGPIYQICKAFRYGELGRHHVREFTLVEWYRPGFLLDQLMTEVQELVASLVPAGILFRRESYRQLFVRRAQLDPWLAADQCIAKRLVRFGTQLPADPVDRDGLLDLLLDRLLAQERPQDGLLLYDFPASQACLATIRRETEPVANRFELYIGGVELANGYHELADPGQQQQRFAADNRKRRSAGKPPRRPDPYLIAALRHGLPDCCGVALGFDRLLMVASGAERVDLVQNFPMP